MDQVSNNALEDEGLIYLLDLRPYVPYHPAHIHKLIRRGEFPKPVKLGRRTAFRRRDIREWVSQQT